MYRHGFRVSELVAIRWDQIDLKQGLLHVNRLKNGVPSTHPLRGPELRALRQLQRDYPSPYVFSTERGGPMTTATVRKMVARAGELTKLSFPIHPHMLRHACGYKLANDGMTREHYNTTSAIRTSSIRCDTPNWHRTVLRISGAIEHSIGGRQCATLSLDHRAADLHDFGVLPVVGLESLHELLGRGVERIERL
jgi:integrase